MFQRSWVWLLAPFTGWTWHFFTLICCNNCYDFFKKTKNKRKETGVGLIKKSFSKVAQKVSTKVFTWKGMFSKSLKSHNIFELLLKEILIQKMFKNRPIWSHCPPLPLYFFLKELRQVSIRETLPRIKRTKHSNFFCSNEFFPKVFFLSKN